MTTPVRIEVLARTQRIVVDPSTSAVSVINAGPQGPPGIGGGSTNSYTHTQVETASSWVINHYLGFKPNITVEEADTGHVVECAEIHHSTIQVELQFNTPRAGTARLS